MTESRTELIIWVNNFLQFQYTKVGQLGTGVAYAQIIDSIYGDVRLAKIKFHSRHEYEHIHNYKVLQRSFEKHKIDKVIPVERLIKCRFQDNLEFLQWIKGFWDTHYQGGVYDALERRQRAIAKAAAVFSGAASPPSFILWQGRRPSQTLSELGSCASSTTSSSTAGTALATPVDTLSGHGYGKKSCRSPSSSSTVFSTNSGMVSSPRATPALSNTNTTIMDLNQHLAQLQMTVKSLQKERDFYLNKLEQIEQIATNHSSPASTANLESVKMILYSTEEGFEIPVERTETF